LFNYNQMSFIESKILTIDNNNDLNYAKA